MIVYRIYSVGDVVADRKEAGFGRKRENGGRSVNKQPPRDPRLVGAATLVCSSHTIDSMVSGLIDDAPITSDQCSRKDKRARLLLEIPLSLH